jgi:hypothetical protein
VPTCVLDDAVLGALRTRGRHPVLRWLPVTGPGHGLVVRRCPAEVTLSGDDLSYGHDEPRSVTGSR